MSDETPRRVKKAPEAPTGYRSTRRASKAVKSAKKAERQHELATGLGRVIHTIRSIGYYLALAVGMLLVGMLVLLLVASAVNWIARWSAGRGNGASTAQTEAERRMRENLLVIGEQDGKATGFLALRISVADKQIYGIAIPDGAFIEVPGQGFGRLGDSYPAGPQVTLTAISNYLTVPFRSYLIVPAAAYQEAMQSQSLAGVLSKETSSNLSAADMEQLRARVTSIPKQNTAIVPLPVQPVHLGSQTYFEPQKAQVADLLTKWWGVDATKVAQATRVILYNGAGTPGIAGVAAQPLIRAGMRVVDTKNADNFNYAKTLIIVQRGKLSQGDEVAKALGVGQVKSQPSDQNIADVIVIVGKDFKPPASGSTGGTK
jgi:hypothetical protein